MEGLLSRCIQSGKSVQKHIQSPGTSFWVQPSHPVLCRSPELGSDLKTKSIGVCVVNLGRQSLETKAFGNFLWTVNVVGFPHVEMKARHIHLASVGSPSMFKNESLVYPLTFIIGGRPGLPEMKASSTQWLLWVTDMNSWWDLETRSTAFQYPSPSIIGP